MCRGRQVRDGGAYGCAVPRAYANLNPGLTLGLGLRFDCAQLHVPYQQAEIGQNTEQSATDNRLCGAFCSTSIAAMQVESGEMPLEIRRTQQELNFAIKPVLRPKVVPKRSRVSPGIECHRRDRGSRRRGG